VASSSGLEAAHESEGILGSFFTHHLVAGLRGAADPRGDGVVTVSDAFAYAKERTVRDTASISPQPQHPSFSMNLRGRADLPLSRIASAPSLVELQQKQGPLQLIHLGTGVRGPGGPVGQARHQALSAAGTVFVAPRRGAGKLLARDHRGVWPLRASERGGAAAFEPAVTLYERARRRCRGAVAAGDQRSASHAVRPPRAGRPWLAPRRGQGGRDGVARARAHAPLRSDRQTESLCQRSLRLLCWERPML